MKETSDTDMDKSKVKKAPSTQSVTNESREVCIYSNS